MFRQKVFKLFHLVNDLAPNTPEKVFLLDHQLEDVKNYLKDPSIDLCGVIGPKTQICQYLEKSRRLLLQQMETEELLDFKQALSLKEEGEDQEKGAIFMVTMNILRERNVAYLILLTDDNFYHQRPFNKKSILYLLVRFIGDLTNNIVLLYDKQMNSEFNSKGCPYAYVEQEMLQLQMVERSIKDVAMKDIKCDYSGLFQFDEKYSKKIDLSVPLPCKNIVYIEKSLIKNAKDRIQLQLSRNQEKLWNKIFLKETIDPTKILGCINMETSQNNINKAKQMARCYMNIRKLTQQFGQKIFNSCIGFILQYPISAKKFSKTFYHQIYKFCVENYISPNFTHKTIGIVGHSYFLKDITHQLLYEAEFKKYIDESYFRKADKYIVLFKPEIEKQWNIYYLKISEQIFNFFNISGFAEKVYDGQEEIQISLFSIRSNYNHEDEIQNISIGERKSLSLKLPSLTPFAQIKDLEAIKSLNVYEINNSRRSKLVWIEFRKSQSRKEHGLLLIAHDNKFQKLTRFTKNCKFIFSQFLHKGYVLFPDQTTLLHFELSKAERMVEEKTVKYSTKRSNQLQDYHRIQSFSVTTLPSETMFYLTENRDVLYSYDFSTKQESSYFHFRQQSGKEIKYLTKPNEPKYEFICTFNEDLYVILGNKTFIDIVHPDTNGGLQHHRRFQYDNSIFMGLTIFNDDKSNEFVLMHFVNQINKENGYMMENLNANNMLEINNQMTQHQGNPIIDIFFEAHQRFGDYKAYSIEENQSNKTINLYHVCDFDEKLLREYLSEAELRHHQHKYVLQSQEDEFIQNFKFQSQKSKSYVNEIQSRIPLQICTLENGNIIPLSQGKKRSGHSQSSTVSQNIYEICKKLDLGIIERVLKENRKMQTVIVSVMGAQSTGKSYLMNMLFGTRFTVASARTTIGIWASLIKNGNFFFLVLDCQGLFAPDRTPKEEEKLVKILASVSDFTILNQNMALNNRNITELMGSIQQSASQLQSETGRYYKGEMVAVVRDVKTTQVKGIQSQFQRVFKVQSSQGANTYLQRLFGGKINLYCLSYYQEKNFEKQIKTVFKYISASKKERRKAEDVLKYLKIRLAELSRDDYNCDQNSEEYDINESQKQILMVWYYGKETEKFSGKILGQDFIIDESQIAMTGLEDFKCLELFENKFQKQIIKHRTSSNFKQAYEEFNSYITDFFDKRFQQTIKKLNEQFSNNLKHIEETKKISQKNDIQTKIEKQKIRFKLCLEKCAKCNLVCVSRYDHKSNLQNEKLSIKALLRQAESNYDTKKLTPEEQQLKDKGLDEEMKRLQTQNSENLQMRDSLLEYQKELGEIKDQKDKIRQNQMEIEDIKRSIGLKNKNNIVSLIQGVLKITSKTPDTRLKLEEILKDMKQDKCTEDKVIQNHMGYLKNAVDIADAEKQTIKISKEQTQGQMNKKKEELEKIQKSQQKANESVTVNQQKKQKLQGDIRKSKTQIQTTQKTKASNQTTRQNKKQQVSKLNSEMQQKTQAIQHKHLFLMTLLKEITNKGERIKQLKSQDQQLEAKAEKVKALGEDILELRKLKTKLKEGQQLMDKTKSMNNEIQKVKINLKLDQNSSFEKIREKIGKEIFMIEKKASRKESEEQKEDFLQKQNYYTYKQLHESQIQFIEAANKQCQGYHQISVEYEKKLDLLQKSFQSISQVKMIKELVQFVIPESKRQKENQSQLKKKITRYIQENNLLTEVSQYFEEFMHVNSEEKQQEINYQLRQLEQHMEEEQSEEDQSAISANIEKLKHQEKAISHIKSFYQQKSEVAQQLSIKYLFLKCLNETEGIDKDIISQLCYPQSFLNKLDDLQRSKDQKNKQCDDAHEEQVLDKLLQELDKIKKQLEVMRPITEVWESVCLKVKKQCENLFGLFHIEFKSAAYDFNRMKMKVFVSVAAAHSIFKVQQVLEKEMKEAAEKYGNMNKLLNLMEWAPQQYQSFYSLIDALSGYVSKGVKYIQDKIQQLVKQVFGSFNEKMFIQIFKEEIIEAELQGIREAKQKNMSQIEGLDKSAKQLQAEYDKSALEIKGIDGEIRDLRSKIDQIKQDIAMLGDKIKQLQGILSSLLKKLNQFTKQLEELEANLKKKLQQLKTLGQQQNQCKNAISQLQVQLERLSEELKQYLQESKDYWTPIIHDFTNQFINRIKSLKKIKQLQQQNQKREGQIDQHQEKIVVIETKYPDISTQDVEQIEIQIQKIDKQIQKVKQLQETIQLLEQYRKRIQNLKADLKEKQQSAKNQCSCKTDHECSSLCELGCNDKKCQGVAGHQGLHFCSQSTHKCKEVCQKPGCQDLCGRQFGHPAHIQHDCYQSHFCNQTCKYCDQMCKFEKHIPHDIHNCNAQKCMMNCILCNGRYCSSKQHNHEDHTQVVTIMYKNPQTNEWEEKKRSLHLCDQEHPCLKDCEKDGICHNTYTTNQRKWIKNNVQKQYTYEIQKAQRGKCQIMIPKGQYKHEGPCVCSAKEHKCKHRCPDCKSSCLLNHGHPEDVKHYTKHRNQQFLLYATQDGNDENSNSKENKEEFSFDVGDVLVPNQCEQSCLKKGRGHYHLKQCLGGENCLEKKLDYGAVHSHKTYQPYPEKRYDKILCRTYWDLHNFKMPSENEEVQMCNFACLQKHNDSKPVYCDKRAWHSFSQNPEQHSFSCAETHKKQKVEKIQICFLLDISGSMQRFIDQSKEAVKRIMAAAQKRKVKVLTSVIGYRDHLCTQSDIYRNIKRLCQDRKKELQQLVVADNHVLGEKSTEIILMKETIELEKKYKQLRDSDKTKQEMKKELSAKENAILKYHSPFYLDIQSSEQMVSALQTLEFPLKFLLLALSSSQLQSALTLKQFLIKRLEKSLQDLLAEAQQEQKKKDKQWKLLEKTTLSAPNQTIQFLDKLDADGGGDPPEAVLDGMDEVSKLNWSHDITTRRYVFHIWDAPPHGRIYGTNNGDRFPDGCPCGKKHETVINKLKKLKLNYMMYPLTPRVNQTLNLFQGCGLEFMKQQIDKNLPEDLNQLADHASAIIIKQIEQTQIEIHK